MKIRGNIVRYSLPEVSDNIDGRGTMPNATRSMLRFGVFEHLRYLRQRRAIERAGGDPDRECTGPDRRF